MLIDGPASGARWNAADGQFPRSPGPARLIRQPSAGLAFPSRDTRAAGRTRTRAPAPPKRRAGIDREKNAANRPGSVISPDEGDRRPAYSTRSIAVTTDTNVLSPNPGAAAHADIDTLDVSDKWKRYFKSIQKYGGLQAPLAKALPPDQRKAALKEMAPPISSFALAFVFGFFYYLVKGMWKKGLVLLAFVLVIVIGVSFALYLVGGETLANATRFLGGAIFGIVAPRDFYAFKVEGDDGWMPVRPF